MLIKDSLLSWLKRSHVPGLYHWLLPRRRRRQIEMFYTRSRNYSLYWSPGVFFYWHGVMLPGCAPEPEYEARRHYTCITHAEKPRLLHFNKSAWLPLGRLGRRLSQLCTLVFSVYAEDVFPVNFFNPLRILVCHVSCWYIACSRLRAGCLWDGV